MEIKKEVHVIEPTVENEAAKVQRTAAYCRVSTDSEDQENSFLAQVKYYNDYIKSQSDMILVDIYADEGITGTCMKKRDEFKRLMKDCTLGRIDRVLVKSVTRFARNSLECLEAIRRMKECGVSVLFENDNLDTKTMNSELILYIKSAFAQNEAIACSRRMTTAYRMKMENGTFITCSAPFGYRLNKSELIVEPSEANIVKKIFSMYLSGVGTNSIAAAMNREATEVKENFSAMTVKYILTNEKYIGDSLLQKTYTPQIFPLRSVTNKGERDKYYIENSHPPIISREEFYTVQRMLSERSAKDNRKVVKRFLTGMIICNECGWAYKHRYRNETDCWICSKNGFGGYRCSCHSVTEKSVYDSFVRMYNKLRCFENEILDSTLSLVNELRNKLILENNEIKQIDIEISKLCDQNDRYGKYHEKKIMDDISYIEQTARIKAKLAELRSRRLKLLSDNENEQKIENLKMLKEIIHNYPTAILDFDETLFMDIVDKLKVTDNGYLIFILKGNLKLKEKMEVSRKCV